MSNLSIEQKLRLSELRLLKESESFVLVKFYDEKEQQEKNVKDSYYISDESDMEEDILKAKYFGTHPKFNLTMPDYKKVSKAFNVKYLKISKEKNIGKTIEKLIKIKGPVICEVMTLEDQSSLFKQGYKKNLNGVFEPQPLSEMFPFISEPIANTNN